MSTSESEGVTKDHPEPEGGQGIVPAKPEAKPAFGSKALVVALLVALASGGVGWVVGDAFRVAEVVDEDEFYGGAELSVPLATRNGAVGYATLGAVLSLGLGVAASLLIGRRSIPGAVVAGLSGVVLGAAAGAASSYGLFPVYFNRMASADVTLSVLIHLGVWSALGAAAGIAFGIGTGSRPMIGRALVGGIVGAGLGTILFDVSGSLFPLAHTERPLSDLRGTRLAGNLLLGLCVATGIVVVASQEPKAKVEKV